MQLVLLNKTLIKIFASILCGVVLADALIEIEFSRVGRSLAISVIGVILLGLGNAIANLIFIECDWRWANNSVVVSG
jgi:hypothetical protein